MLLLLLLLPRWTLPQTPQPRPPTPQPRPLTQQPRLPQPLRLLQRRLLPLRPGWCLVPLAR